MRPPAGLLVLRTAALIALLVSGALLVDYQGATPAFCEAGSTCDQIKSSAFGRPLGVPVPVIGIVCFLGLMMLSVMPGSVARLWTRRAAIAGGVTAFLLLAVQAVVIGGFCKLCVMVDSSAIVAMLAAISMMNPRAATATTPAAPALSTEGIDEALPGLRAVLPERDWLPPVSWLVLALCAVGAGAAWTMARPPADAPDEIRAQWKPGAVNVVDFSDFECPFCRVAHPRIHAALEGVQGVHFVRKTVPLQMHPHARFASRAYLCAAAQGKGEEVADALFTSDQLGVKDCEKIAVDHGVALDTYRACVDSPDTDKTIEEHTELFKKAHMRGLPSVWIGNELVGGAVELEVYQAAVTRATQARTEGNVWPLVGLITAALAAVGVGLWRQPRAVVRSS